MANESSVSVTITASEQVLEELQGYIKAAQGGEDCYYNIISTGYDVCSQDGEVTLSGSAAGRWSYVSNLTGYFDGITPSWLEGAADTLQAWNNLLRALVTTQTSITISYTETEPGMGFIALGEAVLGVDRKGTPHLDHNSESHDMTVANLIKFADCGIENAIWDCYGDEVYEIFEKQKQLIDSMDFNVLQMELEQAALRDALLELGEYDLEGCECIATQLAPYLES